MIEREIQEYVRSQILIELNAMLLTHALRCDSCSETDPKKDKPCDINAFIIEYRDAFEEDAKQ